MVPSPPRAAVLAAMVFVFLASIARAGQVGTADSAGSGGDPSLDLPFTFDGPAVPVAPNIISRDADGRATLRAVRLSAPIKLDGELDEAVYAATPSFTDFFQMEPVEGQVATEKTEGWLFFDEDAIYVTFRCWESRPDALVANEMRRDNNNIFQNDHIAFLIDPFYDRRNGLEFAINPIGGRWDGQITNERQFNA
ncbi:MAG TPA: hypothetical protein VIZ32_15575, partial [Vicinamibacterales bacterium]